MKRILFLSFVVVVLSVINGCCEVKQENNCTCDPCRMGWTHVRCFNTYKQKAVTPVADTVKNEETQKVNQVTSEAIKETKEEIQKNHVKAIPSYVEFVLESGSLKGAEQAKEQPEKPITMIFTERDKKIMVAGCSGVNRYFGNIVITKESNEIKFGKMGSTMMMGPGMEVEQIFLSNLEKVAKYNIVDDKLSLMNANGEILAIFKLNK